MFSNNVEIDTSRQDDSAQGNVEGNIEIKLYILIRYNSLLTGCVELHPLTTEQGFICLFTRGKLVVLIQ